MPEAAALVGEIGSVAAGLAVEGRATVDSAFTPPRPDSGKAEEV